MSDSGRTDRIKGVMLGMACGDALGAGYETGKRVPERGASMCGGGFGFEPGQYTDDTEQAVCVAAGRSQPLKVAANLLQWYAGHPKDVGGQTSAVMRKAKTPAGLIQASRAFALRQSGQAVRKGWDPGTGNGSLMRCGPTCLPFLGDSKRIAEAAREVSDLTHADAWSGDACVLWSLAISDAIEMGGKFNLEEAMFAALEYLPEDRRDFWYNAICDSFELWLGRFRRNGSAVGCFKAALAAVYSAESLEEGLQLAVGIGGDTDTVAAVAGALLGAVHGASSVPAKWRRKVWGWPGMKAAGLEKLAIEAASAAITEKAS